jgi:hypothetical protein
MGSSDIGISSGTQRPLALFEAAFEAGVRHFDTAPLYGIGLAERCLGEFLARHPDEVTITGKYGLPAPKVGAFSRLAIELAGPLVRKAARHRKLLGRPWNSAPGDGPGPILSVEAARATLENSLRELRTERIHIWLLHEATAASLNDERLLRFLEDTVREGKVGAFGIGGAASKMPEIYATRRDYCPVIQCEWDVLEPDISYSGTFRSRFGVFQCWPARITEHLSQNAAAARSWSDEVGTDLTAPGTLNSLILRAALISNPDGLIIFQSRSKENIGRNAKIAGDATLDQLALRLLALLRRSGPALRHA